MRPLAPPSAWVSARQQQQGHLADPDMALREPPKPPPSLVSWRARACCGHLARSCPHWFSWERPSSGAGVSLDDLNPMGSAGGDSGCMPGSWTRRVFGFARATSRWLGSPRWNGRLQRRQAHSTALSSTSRRCRRARTCSERSMRRRHATSVRERALSCRDHARVESTKTTHPLRSNPHEQHPVASESRPDDAMSVAGWGGGGDSGGMRGCGGGCDDGSCRPSVSARVGDSWRRA